MATPSAAAELEQAHAAYGRAFNGFGLGRRADTRGVLHDAERALDHLRAAIPDGAGQGTAFIRARIADTGDLLRTLRAVSDVPCGDVAVGLLAVDFLLRAVGAQCDSRNVPAECINCHSTHLTPRDGGTPEAPLYQCTDCGLTASYRRR